MQDICVSISYLIKLISKLSYHPAGLVEDSAWVLLGILLHRGPSVKKQEISLASADSWPWLLQGRLEVLLLSGALVLLFRHLQKSWEAENLIKVPQGCVISWVEKNPIFLFLKGTPLSLAPRGFQHSTFTDLRKSLLYVPSIFCSARILKERNDKGQLPIWNAGTRKFVGCINAMQY